MGNPSARVMQLGSMSGDRKRGQGGDQGAGTGLQAIDNSYSRHHRQARLPSALQLAPTPFRHCAPTCPGHTPAGLSPLRSVETSLPK